MRRAAVVGSGVLGALGGAGYGTFRLLVAQGAAADAAVRPYVTPPPAIVEWYGDPSDPQVTLAVLGDSSAAGIGVPHFDDSFGGWIAQRLAEQGHRVRVLVAAENGTRAEHLDAQVDLVVDAKPDFVAISTGVNDVRNRTIPRRAAQQLAAAVVRLQDAGATVAVGTTPYLNILTQVPQPLRGLGHLVSRVTERAQVSAVEATGAAVVPLGKLLTPLFGADPTLFSQDGFHPSKRGYALIGEHLLAALLSEG